MNRKLFLRLLVGSVAMLCAHAAFGKTVKIDAGDSAYSGYAAINQANVSQEAEHRINAGWAAWGRYTSLNGIFSLPKGSLIELTYTDGSKETLLVSCTNSQMCVQPVPGTQKPAPAKSGGGGGSGGVDVGGGDFGGGQCSVRPRTGTACTEANGIRRCERFEDSMVDCGFG